MILAILLVVGLVVAPAAAEAQAAGAVHHIGLLDTAKALALTVPPSLLLRADRVIE